ncbi:MAG: hypothetical protein CUN56_06950 [Phototrophicales bacterium]|nr:MAG: hypothetical protein CUN56_06950 [Phototrophicales bacterium]RMG72906.1 MAG: hypothetical protein D6711_12055 [Chloroflexota bacterium]
MAWRLHLANQAIQRLDILDNLLAIWKKPNQLTYYDLHTGVLQHEQTLSPPKVESWQDDAWQIFLAEFTAPNKLYLPTLTLDHQTVYLSEDGLLRLYQDDTLQLENDGQYHHLDVADPIAVGLDRFLGLVAVIDTERKLHIFQQQIKIGVFDLPFTQAEYFRPMLTVANGGTAIYVTDGQQIALIDSSGKVKKQIKTYYDIRHMTCSPDGNHLITSDMDSGVIRLYQGHDLTLTHQRFAIDLVAEATQVQLMADMPPIFVALSALTIDNHANIAFSMSGVICVTDLSHLDQLPRPQVLL